MESRRRTGLIATAATGLLCGCPGLFAFFFGALTSIISFIPGAAIDIQGRDDPRAALLMGIGALLLGVILIAIPIIVALSTLRRKPSPPASDEPIPPPI
jgi:hypothetical protein